MNNQKLLIAVLAIIIVAAGALFIAGRVDAPQSGGVPNIPDTQTGDTGDEGPTSVPVQITTKIDQGASALGMKIVPVTVLEDSRCPADVVCIQAGTVRVQARVTHAEGEEGQEFKLGQPVSIGGAEVTLVDVKPYPYAGKPTAPADYEFIWEIKAV